MENARQKCGGALALLLFLLGMPAGAATMTAKQPEGVQFRRIGADQVAYVARGKGPALVLVHGMFGDHLDWEPVIEPLARRHRVIAVDLPGFGDSDKPDREYTGDYFVETLEALLRQLKVKRATLVGNSFGGQMALLYALKYPERVERLVLVSSGGFREVADTEKQFYRERFSAERIAALTPEVNGPMFAPVFAKESDHRRLYVEKQNAKLQRADYPAYARSLARNIQLALNTYLLDRLGEIRCPTLLLWGDKDIVLPLAQAQAALPRLPHGKLTTLEGCGHAPQLDCPEAFATAVEQFLAAPPEGKGKK